MTTAKWDIASSEEQYRKKIVAEKITSNTIKNMTFNCQFIFYILMEIRKNNESY